MIPNRPPIVNLFDISTSDGREHFLLANILALIERLGSTTGEGGFVGSSKIYDFCQSLGFSPGQIEFALQRGCLRELMDPSPKLSGEPITSYRITTAGAYSFRELPRHFSYADAMVVDTPIVDPDVRSILGNVGGIGERLKRMEVFLKYLNDQYSPLAQKPVVFDWPSMSQAIASEVSRVQDRYQARKASRSLRHSWRQES
jgi:hypothetical protein